jgi:hypothetical protein
MSALQLSVQTIEYCAFRGIDPIQYSRWRRFIEVQQIRIYHKKQLQK